MNDILQLQLASDSLNMMKHGKTKTPGEIGSSIFETLLSRINDSSGNNSFFSSLYQGKAVGKNHFPDSDGKQENSGLLEELNEKMGCLFLPNSRFVLPESVLPQLIVFLKKQGFSAEKMNRILLSIKNGDGSLQVDKLLAQLFSKDSSTAQQEKSPVIQSNQIPRVEELLFKMGLGAGEVKEIIENSVNRRGELVFTRLTDSLEKYSDSRDLKSDLLSLLRKNDVTVNSPFTLFDNKILNTELKNTFKGSMETSLSDFQKEIKQNLAVLLRNKGIPPQEVKSYLESVNIEFSRSLLKTDSDQAPGLHMILNQAFLKNQPHWRKDIWHEKMMSILKDNHFITKNADGSSFQEQGDIKLNLAEILKQGDTKVRPEFILGLSEDKKLVEFEKAGTRLYKGNREFLIKDGVGSDLILNKRDNDFKGTAAIKNIKNMYNLPQPLPKVLDRMIWMIQAGEQKSRILIHPPELGRLDVNLAIKNGHLQANLSAESIMVKEIIEANLNQLKQQLNDQGLIVDRFEVMVGLDDGRLEEGPMWSWNEHRGSFSAGKSGAGHGGQNQDEKSVERFVDSPYQIDVHV